MTRCVETEFSRPTIELLNFARIGFYTLADVVGPTESKGSFGIALPSRLPVSLHRLGIVLRHALAGAVHEGEAALPAL